MLSSTLSSRSRFGELACVSAFEARSRGSASLGAARGRPGLVFDLSAASTMSESSERSSVSSAGLINVDVSPPPDARTMPIGIACGKHRVAAPKLLA